MYSGHSAIHVIGKLRYTFYILRDKLVEGIVNKNSTKIIFSFFGLSRATSATHAGTRDYD